MIERKGRKARRKSEAELLPRQVAFLLFLYVTAFILLGLIWLWLEAAP